MQSPPQDSRHVALFIFLLQGVGMLFPWNVFINAEDYFLQRFRDSDFEGLFEDSFSVCYNAASVIGLIFALRFQHHFSIRWRVMVSLSVCTFAMVMCCILVILPKARPSQLFIITMMLVIICGLAAAILQGALFAFGTFFPPKYTQAMLVGQAVAGLAVSLASIFTDLAGQGDYSCLPDMDPHTTDFLSIHNQDELHQVVRSAAGVEAAARGAGSSRVLRSLDAETPEYTTDWETLAYFVIAVGVLLSCLVTYPMLERLPLAKFYAQPSGQSAAVDQCGGHANGGEAVNGSWGEVCDEADGNDASMESSASRAPSGTPTFHRLATKNLLREGQDSSVVGKENQGDDPVVEKSGLIHGLRVRLAPIFRYAFSVFLVFTITLALFPGATSKIVSRIRCRPGRSRFFSRDTFTLFSFVSFNAFDILGRVMSSAVALPDAWLPAAAMSRSVFFVLFLGCRSESARTRVLFPSDVFPLVTMPLFGFTNGYVATRAMMAGSRYGPWAATAMTMFLLCGLLSGSLLSFLVLYLSTGSID